LTVVVECPNSLLHKLQVNLFALLTASTSNMVNARVFLTTYINIFFNSWLCKYLLFSNGFICLTKNLAIPLVVEGIGSYVVHHYKYTIGDMKSVTLAMPMIGLMLSLSAGILSSIICHAFFAQPLTISQYYQYKNVILLTIHCFFVYHKKDLINEMCQFILPWW